MAGSQTNIETSLLFDEEVLSSPGDLSKEVTDSGNGKLKGLKINPFFTSDNTHPFEKIDGVNKVTQDGREFVIQTTASSRVLGELSRISEENGFSLENITVRKATLEDVFLALTGRKLRG